MNLQNSNRDRAKLIISLSPGIHLRKLQKLLGSSFSTTRYHVENLERDGEIVRSRDGRYDRLYPSGTADSARAVYAALQSKTARRVLQTLVNEQGEITNGDLSERIHLPRSTVSECITYLAKVNLVRRSFTVDSRIVYEIQDREQVLQLLSVFEKNLLNIASDRFIELWDI